MKLNKKQTAALDYLEDGVTTELLYGGGAGGGKSILGCYWLTKCSLKYPGTRWLMGRAVMKTLKETTLQSFLKVAKLQGLQNGLHYTLTSAQDKENPNAISFPNKSVILMKDLATYPSDPDFDDLGSLEISGAFIDEANQVSAKAKEIVSSRIRHDLELHGLIPKILMTCNPAKNWTYQDFYKPSKDGTIAPYRKFIQALVGDNPDVDKNYRENLTKLSERSKQRLLYGNWEFDDDPATLIEYDKIINSFTNEFLPDGNPYITADIARYGGDKVVICVWSGWRVVKIYTYGKKAITETAAIIQDLQRKYSVSNSNTIADDDGVGGGVVDLVKCKGFVNNAIPISEPDTPKDPKTGQPIKPNYKNLKSQCYFRLAERINSGGLYIGPCELDVREKIIQELEQVKQHDMDKDGKRQVVPKDKVKELIGRSPDYSDAIMMREYFELKPKRRYVGAGY